MMNYDEITMKIMMKYDENMMRIAIKFVDDLATAGMSTALKTVITQQLLSRSGQNAMKPSAAYLSNVLSTAN